MNSAQKSRSIFERLLLQQKGQKDKDGIAAIGLSSA